MAFAWKRDLKIYCYYGAKGNGKSYFCAYILKKLIDSYYRIEKYYPNLPHRRIFTNQKLAPDFEKKELHTHLEYWSHPRELYHLRNVDILWDEIGKDLPAGSFATTPKSLKQIFSHLRKRGNRLFANTQVFEDIDVSFRRQIDFAFHIKKLCGSQDVSATLPPPKFIWGVIQVRRFDPLFLEAQRDPLLRDMGYDGMPRWYVIRKKYIQLYDTTMELPAYKPDKLEETILTCVEGERCADYDPKTGCPHQKIIHTPF